MLSLRTQSGKEMHLSQIVRNSPKLDDDETNEDDADGGDDQ